ncbi:hypothetical protein SLA2020_156540 [Shorea laevis]
MTNRARKNKSLSKKSMRLVANILRLSSLYLATVTLRSQPKLHGGGRNFMPRPPDSAVDVSSMTAPIRQPSPRDVEPHSDDQMDPANNNIDERASGFITRIYEKNRRQLMNSA